MGAEYRRRTDVPKKEATDADSRWKSNFEREFARLSDAVEALRNEREAQRDAIERLTRSVDDLNKVLSNGRGGLEVFYLLAKISAAGTAIVAAVTGIIWLVRSWPIK